MRLLAQFVGVLLLVGFVGAYFWWIVAALAVAGHGRSRAEFESDARRRAERAIALIRRDD